jgi:hypothetical protein
MIFNNNLDSQLNSHGVQKLEPRREATGNCNHTTHLDAVSLDTTQTEFSIQKSNKACHYISKNYQGQKIQNFWRAAAIDSEQLIT